MLGCAKSGALLHRHPDTPCPAISNIAATILWNQEGCLELTYTIDGIIDCLRISPYRSKVRVDGLWQHTCFELFIRAKDDAEYYEFNFAPSGAWAVYSFSGYRHRISTQVESIEPKIAVLQDAARFTLSADIRLDSFPEFRPGVCLSLGLSAVIEESDGALSYWALKHPPGKPDFHHADAFALELSLARDRESA